jgi:outer membrane protein assembly factor BamB
VAGIVRGGSGRTAEAAIISKYQTPGLKIVIRRVLLAIVISLLSARMLSAQPGPLDYPQWRGPHRDGSAAAFRAPKTWPETLTRRWHIEIGAGYGTPLVVADTVFTFTRRDGREILTAVDVKNGARRWESGYLAPYSPSGPAAAHGAGPKATPLYYRDKIFTLGISGIVSAFDASSGRLLWQTDAPSEPPIYGAASSPLGEDDLVIVHPGAYGPLTAYDQRTGTVRWTAGGDGFFASPIAVDAAGTRQVITATLDSVIGVALDGRVLWRYPWEGAGGSTTPLWFDDTVIVSALDKGVTAIKPKKLDGAWVAEKVWDTRDVSMYLSNPVVTGDILCGLSFRSRGQFFALDARSGRTLWLGSSREADNTAVVKSGEFLLLLNDDAELIVARANRSRLEPVKRYQVADSATWAQPAISGNRIFVKDAAFLTLWIVD